MLNSLDATLTKNRGGGSHPLSRTHRFPVRDFICQVCPVHTEPQWGPGSTDFSLCSLQLSADSPLGQLLSSVSSVAHPSVCAALKRSARCRIAKLSNPEPHKPALCWIKKTAEPSQFYTVRDSAARNYLATLSYPFTGMVTGFASLNVNLLLAASRVTFLFALALSVSLSSFLAWLFGPAIELVSSG